MRSSLYFDVAFSRSKSLWEHAFSYFAVAAVVVEHEHLSKEVKKLLKYTNVKQQDRKKSAFESKLYLKKFL